MCVDHPFMPLQSLTALTVPNPPIHSGSFHCSLDTSLEPGAPIPLCFQTMDW